MRLVKREADLASSYGYDPDGNRISRWDSSKHFKTQKT
jgi:hypothetical protein